MNIYTFNFAGEQNPHFEPTRLVEYWKALLVLGLTLSTISTNNFFAENR